MGWGFGGQSSDFQKLQDCTRLLDLVITEYLVKIVGFIWRKPVPTHAISVSSGVGGNGEYGEYGEKEISLHKAYAQL